MTPELTPETRAAHVLELCIPVYRAGDDPKLEWQLAQAIRAAVRVECDRCAKLVENWGRAPNPGGLRAQMAADIRKGA